MQEVFRKFAVNTAKVMGSPIAFITGLALIFVWAAFGPFCHYSDTWQLIINTSTTVVTFLMVFVIQNAQNRDSATVQLKLDELLRAVKEARNSMVSIEDLSEKDLEELKEQYRRLREAKPGVAAAVQEVECEESQAAGKV